MTIDLSIISNHLLKPQSFPVNTQKAGAHSPASPAVANSQTQSTSTDTPEDQLQKAVEQIQNVTDKLAQNLHFSIDKETGITIIKVMDAQTEEVIRQIPTEEAITIARTLDKVQGLLFDSQA